MVRLKIEVIFLVFWMEFSWAIRTRLYIAYLVIPPLFLPPFLRRPISKGLILSPSLPPKRDFPILPLHILHNSLRLHPKGKELLESEQALGFASHLYLPRRGFLLLFCGNYSSASTFPSNPHLLRHRGIRQFIPFPHRLLPFLPPLHAPAPFPCPPTKIQTLRVPIFGFRIPPYLPSLLHRVFAFGFTPLCASPTCTPQPSYLRRGSIWLGIGSTELHFLFPGDFLRAIPCPTYPLPLYFGKKITCLGEIKSRAIPTEWELYPPPL